MPLHPHGAVPVSQRYGTMPAQQMKQLDTRVAPLEWSSEQYSHGTSRIMECSSSRTHRQGHYRRRRFWIALAVALVGCSTMPPGCQRDTIPSMKEVLFKSNGEFWFSHALVKFGYHHSGIAPEELLRDPNAEYIPPLHFVLKLAPDCSVGKRLRASVRGADFYRVSGRGHFVGESTLEVDCLCSLEATTYTDRANHYSQFY